MSAPAAPFDLRIRGLTIHQPWAWLIAQGHKPIENRTWKPPASAVGGYLAIHAGKKFDPGEVRSDFQWAWINALPRHVGAFQSALMERLASECGSIIAVARLTGWIDASASPWFFGPIGWTLADVVAIDPVPCRGAQGLWTLPPDVLARVERAMILARPMLPACVRGMPL